MSAKYRITPNLEEQIKESNLPKGVLKQGWISSRDVRVLLTRASSKTKLLEELEFYIPPKEKPAQTKEFQQQMQKLRALEQEQEYQKLLNRPSLYEGSIVSKKLGEQEEAISPSQFAKQVKEQLTTIVNVLVTCGLVAFAVWYWTGTSMNVQVSQRVFLSLFFGLLVLVAEVVVYNGYLRRMEEAKAKERKKKEVKKVVETVVLKKGKAREKEKRKSE